MMPRIKTAVALMVLAGVVGERRSAKAAEDLPAGATVLDPDIILHSWPYPVVSPDGRWVAYISRGYVRVVGLDGSEPRQLSEVPGTWTHLLAQPENAFAKGDRIELARGKSREEYAALRTKAPNQAFGMHWTHDSTGIVFGMQSPNAKKDGSIFEASHVPLKGDVEQLSRLEQSYSRHSFGNEIRLTRDRKFLVWGAGGRQRKPVIWDVATNKPRATCFLNLTPSTTSGRWIGIEKDSRQLVVTDESFNITSHYEDFLPTRSFGAELIWSPDERFVILRNQVGFDHYSNWEGYRLDLETKERRILTGSYWEETIQFTGRGGEFLREAHDGVQGGISGLIQTGAYLQIVPQGAGFPQRLWSMHSLPGGSPEKKVRLPTGIGHSLRWSPDFERFIFGVPRQTGSPGVVAHLVDRERHVWQLPGADSGEYESPYTVVGFADGGKSIIAYDDRRLFLLPVEANLSDGKKVR